LSSPQSAEAPLPSNIYIITSKVPEKGCYWVGLTGVVWGEGVRGGLVQDG